jgi:hypothetical protein
MISHRLIDTYRAETRDPALQPPAWINQLDTMQFHVVIPNGKVAPSSAFISLSASNTIHVEVTHAVGALLPAQACPVSI